MARDTGWDVRKGVVDSKTSAQAEIFLPGNTNRRFCARTTGTPVESAVVISLDIGSRPRVFRYLNDERNTTQSTIASKKRFNRVANCLQFGVTSP
jgi:hypothetical protein